MKPVIQGLSSKDIGLGLHIVCFKLAFNFALNLLLHATLSFTEKKIDVYTVIVLATLFLSSYVCLIEYHIALFCATLCISLNRLEHSLRGH